MPSVVGSELFHTRSVLAVATRLGTPEQVAEAKRAHAAAKLAAVIKKTVDAAPPLTGDQVARLATLLRGAA